MSGRTRRTLLVIDDDRLFCDVVAQHLAESKVNVRVAHTGAEGLAACARENVDVVLLDQQLPDAAGKDLCPAILAHNDQAKIIFATGYPSFDNAVEAIKVGAYDYLSKPIELEELDLAVRKALRTMDLERVEQVQTYISGREKEETVLVGRDEGLAALDQLIDLAAASDAAVLITGETGTGKSFVARAIHYRGHEKKAAFISLNCASLPENLVESELFGHEKGAFSGAVTAKRGIFEMAEGGTLALEEIGELPPSIQSKLLGVLDHKKVRRLGGESERPVNVRIVATTNVDLERAVAEKAFRQDLYYRLGVMRLHVPPLRTRPQDIPALCRFFLQDIAPQLDLDLPEDEMGRLRRYQWPGNVRELRNVLERSIILRTGRLLRPSRLLGQTPGPGAAPEKTLDPPAPAEQDLVTLKEAERRYIKRALEFMQGNHTRTAQALGVSRSTLIRKIKEYNL
ncbi:MAG: sigma-54 dependent transcriptional regulator [Thermodesulfobacteriota bacterium]